MTQRLNPPSFAGPALNYTSSPDENGAQHTARIDRAALTDPRERALCRALLLHALRLLDEAEMGLGPELREPAP